MKQVIRVGVSGGAGQICYSLLFRIASGEMFGKETQVILHILEIPQALNSLRGIELELYDSAFPTLKGIVIGSNPKEVLEGVDFALLVGSKPRSKGMERADLLKENAKIFVEQGKALAHSKAKILVVGNPCNTNALVLLHHAKGVPPEHIRCMTRLDQNRAIAQLALHTGVEMSEVKKTIIWGNHSPTMVPDYEHVTIQGKAIKSVIQGEEWLKTTFMQKVKQRGTEVLETRGLSSAASAATGVISAVRDWVYPTDKGDYYSSGIYSKGNPYGIEENLFYSFPMQNGKIVEGLAISPFMQEKIRESEEELIRERDAVKEFLRG